MRYLLAFMMVGLATAPAVAAPYRFTATGTLGTPYSVDSNFNPIPTPAMTIKAGDTFAISFTIDPAAYSVTSFYDADPTINIYYGSVSSYSASIGSYSDVLPSGTMPFSSIQLWNNYISGGMPVDLFEVNALAALSSAASPVSLGNGVINETFGFYAFDFSATARSSDLINQITPLTGLPTQSAYIGYLNSMTYDQTTFSILGLKTSIVNIGAVPEPDTWAMMTLGFGIVGYALRHRQKVTLRFY